MSRLFLLGTAMLMALVMGAKMALDKQPDSVLAIQSSSMLPMPSPVAPSPERQISPSTESPVPPPVSVSTPTPNYYSQRINTCAGAGSNANFRANPSLDPRSVLGVIAYGESVELTGRTIQGDGVTWYEAIAPALYPSPDAEAQNRLDAGQTGWIASCFLIG